MQKLITWGKDLKKGLSSHKEKQLHSRLFTTSSTNYLYMQDKCRLGCIQDHPTVVLDLKNIQISSRNTEGAEVPAREELHDVGWKVDQLCSFPNTPLLVESSRTLQMKLQKLHEWENKTHICFPLLSFWLGSSWFI